MKNIFLILIIPFLINCAGNNTSQCIKPEGIYSFNFREISGDCGPINPQIEDIDRIGLCTNTIRFDKEACTYSIYDECVENMQEVEFTYLSKDRIEGEVFIWLQECQSRYEVIGTK